MADPVRVMIVDDHVLIRRGLTTLLAVEDQVEVVAEAAGGHEALRLLPSCRPDVVLVDARMPGMDGVELIAQLHARAPDVAALMLTTFDDDAYVFGALRAGARGYLLKDTSPEDLVDAIGRARRGDMILGGDVAARVVAEVNRHPSRPAARLPEGRLTDREREIVGLVGDGLTNAQIARRLFLADGTVRNQISRILTKLDLHDRTQLAIWAHRTGTTDG